MRKSKTITPLVGNIKDFTYKKVNCKYCIANNTDIEYGKERDEQFNGDKKYQY